MLLEDDYQSLDTRDVTDSNSSSLLSDMLGIYWLGLVYRQKEVQRENQCRSWCLFLVLAFLSIITICLGS